MGWSGALDHILETHESRVIASFDVDQLLDYRGRRPVMVFDRDHWSSYDDPSLLLHRVVDKEGVPFLLLVIANEYSSREIKSKLLASRELICEHRPWV